MPTYLVETLEQANDAALDLLLLQATASAVHADGNNSLDTDGHGDARSSHCRSSDNVRGGRAGGGADGRAEDSCAEHDGIEKGGGLSTRTWRRVLSTGAREEAIQLICLERVKGQRGLMTRDKRVSVDDEGGFGWDGVVMVCLG